MKYFPNHLKRRGMIRKSSKTLANTSNWKLLTRKTIYSVKIVEVKGHKFWANTLVTLIKTQTCQTQNLTVINFHQAYPTLWDNQPVLTTQCKHWWSNQTSISNLKQTSMVLWKLSRKRASWNLSSLQTSANQKAVRPPSFELILIKQFNRFTLKKTMKT